MLRVRTKERRDIKLCKGADVAKNEPKYTE